MNPQPSTLNQFTVSTVITAPPKIDVEPVVVHKTNTKEEHASNSDIGIILGLSLIGVLGLWRLSKMMSR